MIRKAVLVRWPLDTTLVSTAVSHMTGNVSHMTSNLQSLRCFLLGDRSHVIERKHNVRTQEKEELQEFVNIDEGVLLHVLLWVMWGVDREIKYTGFLKLEKGGGIPVSRPIVEHVCVQMV